jgi:hypothetical protein
MKKRAAQSNDDADSNDEDVVVISDVESNKNSDSDKDEDLGSNSGAEEAAVAASEATTIDNRPVITWTFAYMITVIVFTILLGITSITLSSVAINSAKKGELLSRFFLYKEEVLTNSSLINEARQSSSRSSEQHNHFSVAPIKPFTIDDVETQDDGAHRYLIGVHNHAPRCAIDVGRDLCVRGTSYFHGNIHVTGTVNATNVVGGSSTTSSSATAFSIDAFGNFSESTVSSIESSSTGIYHYVIYTDLRSDKTLPDNLNTGDDLSSHMVAYNASDGVWTDYGRWIGLTGSQGQPGPQGSPGINGSIGDTGPQGPQGPQGVAGLSGILLTGILFGDGSDGSVTISTNTTLTRDMYYMNLTINADAFINAAGFRVFVKNVLTFAANTSAIRNNGGTGGTVTGGTGAVRGTLGGGGDGGTGVIYNGGVNWTACTGGGVPIEPTALGGMGGDNAAFGGSTCFASALTPPGATIGGIRIFSGITSAMIGRTLDNALVGGGSGGAGGGQSDGNIPASAGGGGGGGGVLFVASQYIVGSGKIQANGGTGGIAQNQQNSQGSGGSGGGGGVVILISTTDATQYPNSNVEANGGAGGLGGVGSGVPDGLNGLPGLTGTVFRFSPTTA